MGLESGSITEVTNRNHNSGEKMIKKWKEKRKPGSSSERINKCVIGRHTKHRK
jgi:hypothetical protein